MHAGFNKKSTKKITAHAKKDEMEIMTIFLTFFFVSFLLSVVLFVVALDVSTGGVLGVCSIVNSGIFSPHSGQNLELSGTSKLHFGHFIFMVLLENDIFGANKKCGNRSYRTEKRKLQLSPNKKQIEKDSSPDQPAEFALLPNSLG